MNEAAGLPGDERYKARSDDAGVAQRRERFLIFLDPGSSPGPGRT